ncbi:ATPase, T2SS/T4P/T4SS family [Paenibacillus caui]|uniref:ATPase, T2SS/T4P/T4SS family n=1 Tax=Paenibacillus caui TaxID=2873927 RepID=UPI001CA87232|nr:ATPase, T2SS/T4P/T4SS family [Paenibacillus caui]
MSYAVWNMAGIALIAACLILYLGFKRQRASGKEQASIHPKDVERYQLEQIIAYVKQALHEMSRNHLDDYGLGEEEYRRKRNQRAGLRQALKGCVSGDIHDKLFVKTYISDLLESGYGLTKEELDHIIPFENRERLTPQDRFEIVLYLYKQQYGDKALAVLIEHYSLDAPKLSGSGDGSFRYEIDQDDIEHVFYMEYRKLDYSEKMDLVVQRVYQLYKGFSVIDEIRDQLIDGVSGGVSGLPDDIRTGQEVSGYGNWPDISEADIASADRSWDSVWIFYRGKSIHLSFLSFGSEGELKRVCQNIYKYNLPGQLSEANAYKVNEMKDGSRVVVVRPPFAESWAFFVRKFDVKNATLEQLITGEGAELVIGLLQFLMKGSRITAITGSQGAGKTTLLMAMIKHIYASYTLRIQEMSFELHLRRLYPQRNILSFRETDYISGQKGLDLQKKTDGSVNILGEVATDEVAAWMIQMSQVASLFTVFTHHAKTFADLIFSLRNSLLKSGMFRDEGIAEKQVVRAVNFDVHLRHDMDGNRYVERITECLPLPEMAQGYTARDIVVYKGGKYEIAEPLSLQVQLDMQREMRPEDAEQFGRFLYTYWGERIGA